MTVAGALLLDAYRQLNARKLFWLTVALSGLITLVYVSIGFDQTGVSMFFGLKHVDSEFVREGTPFARILYRGIFSTFIVSTWLAWIATILALISTSTIFPDFLAEGAVDLVLSKPVSRIRLFVLRYLTSLLFVLLQVGIVCLGVFVAMGWRLGEWNWLILAAIPLVTLFYSYLYSVTVLVGVVTRSALAALLLTMLFWFSVFSITQTWATVRMFSLTAEIEGERNREDAAALRTRLDGLEDVPENDAIRARLQREIDDEETEAERREELVATLEPWGARVGALQAVLPKTGETIALLDRWLKEDTDVNLFDVMSGNVDMNGGEATVARRGSDREVQQRLMDEMESRSWWWIIGSSVAFELVVLALACFVFARRDF